MRTTLSSSNLSGCFTGDRGWGDLTWNIVEPGKLIRTDTQLGSYSLELQPDGKTYRLTFNSGSRDPDLPDEVSGNQ